MHVKSAEATLNQVFEWCLHGNPQHRNEAAALVDDNALDVCEEFNRFCRRPGNKQVYVLVLEAFDTLVKTAQARFVYQILNLAHEPDLHLVMILSASSDFRPLLEPKSLSRLGS